MTYGLCSSSRTRTPQWGRDIAWFGQIALLLLLVPAVARGQFFRVYEYKTADAGAVEISYWTTYVGSSDEEMGYFDKTLSREKMWAHSFEVEYGLSHRLTVGYYADCLDPQGGSFEYVRSKLLARYRLYEKYERPVDLALYGEYILPDKDYDDSEKFEFRLVVEKDIGPVRVALNPILEKKTSGDDVEEGVEFAYAAGFYYDDAGDGLWSTPDMHIRPGLEFYGELGELSDPKGSSEQGHYIFPVLDLYYTGRTSWKTHWNVGVGFGLGGEADDVVAKSILTFEFLF
jgi:hypothetical protein